MDFVLFSRVSLVVLVFVLTINPAHACIKLLNGWTRMTEAQRAQLAKVVFIGKVADIYSLDNETQTYAADFEIHRVLKGRQIIDEVLAKHPGRTVKVYGFGEKRMCFSEVYKGETHMVFMVYHAASGSLVARYDDIFGAISRATEENENEVLSALGWREWSPWSMCTRSCSSGTQWRTRQCVHNSCDGRSRDGRKCNFFSCYGIKNVGQYFSPAHPNRVSSVVRSGIPRHIRLRGDAPLTLRTPQVFQYYFPDHYSILITFRVQRHNSDLYLLALKDYESSHIQFAIRLARNTITFELAKNMDYNIKHRWSYEFNVGVVPHTWHSATFSLRERQITFYWDCEKAGSKSLPGRFTFAPDPLGSISLGQPVKARAGNSRHTSKNARHRVVEIRELFFIPDTRAARQHCQKMKFSTRKPSRGFMEGSGFDADLEGSGSNYVDDPEQIDMEWSSWSPCSQSCGRGLRRRVMMCVNLDDRPPSSQCLQALQTSEEKPCNLQECPAQCGLPCLNGGSCVSRNTCACKKGYTGERCEKVTCRTRCYNGGSCIGPETCKCSDGFTGPQCKSPVCKTNCLNGGVCIGPGRCHCPPGYLQPNCRAQCTPTCSNGGRCVGPNTCLCPPGYHGNHCQKVCRRPCLNGGHCYAPDTCSCPYGWHGATCDRARCYPKCRHGGKCVKPNMCMCPRGLYGYYCQNGSRY
ncbi:uncharacterized protein LOC5521805 isoform X2 [Nematostella vectensis]|uniref:uncharacterized protein LOC5521805 isoform X2 n=1 Tax=Nematostella vectensis TaxID=45351 RepID=UPI00138FF244|nr:uncharacterized protein LOC5521805 isoform X2 [Nematostella vectensis]